MYMLVVYQKICVTACQECVSVFAQIFVKVIFCSMSLGKRCRTTKKMSCANGPKTPKFLKQSLLRCILLGLQSYCFLIKLPKKNIFYDYFMC